MAESQQKNREVLAYAANYANRYLTRLEQCPVKAKVETEEIRERLEPKLPEYGIPPNEVVQELVDNVEDGILHSASGRFFAWVVGGALESAMAMDWLTSCWDQNAALSCSSPAASVVEETVGEWLKELLELDKESSFALTTGCQMAHFTCLAAARFELLSQAGYDVHQSGLNGAPRLSIFVGANAHRSSTRALRFLGFGSEQIKVAPMTGDGLICAQGLERHLAKKQEPTIVILCAGDINTGAFDNLKDLIPICKKRQAWVHVDAAFGLFVRTSSKKRGLIEGIELADSVAADAHKWLNVPYDSGLAFIRHSEAHKKSMVISADYISSTENSRDPMDWNPEWSRRARGFSLYAAIRELGRAGIEKMVDDHCQMAAYLVEEISKLPDVEVLSEPIINQGLVRFRDNNPTAAEVDHDAKTRLVIKLINETGEAFFSGTVWAGIYAMRISVVNWRTTPNDIERAVAAIRGVLESVSEQNLKFNSGC